MGKLNNFEQYGFTADFEGEILKEIKGFYIGYIILNDEEIYSARWNQYGVEVECILDDDYKYCLTPIHKEWYKKEDNFPVMIVWENKYYGKDGWFIASSIFNNKFIDANGEIIGQISEFRLGTKEEIESLILKEIQMLKKTYYCSYGRYDNDDLVGLSFRLETIWVWGSITKMVRKHIKELENTFECAIFLSNIKRID